MIKKPTDIMNIHKNEVVYIIGTGIELVNLPENVIDQIKNGISIGLNSTHLFLPETTYHCAGHPIQYLLNVKYGNVKGCRIYSGTWQPKILEEKSICMKVQDLNFANAQDPNISQHQVSFNAINAACLMGSKKIVFVGIDMKNKEHYYDLSLEMKQKLLDQTNTIKNEENLDTAVKDDTNVLLDILNGKNPEFKYDWFKKEYTQLFQSLWNNSGISCYTYNPDSIIHESGATLISYGDRI